EMAPTAVGTVSYREHLAAAKDRRPREFEFITPTQHRWVEVHIYPSETGLSVYFQDIDARKHAEQERARLLREVERLAAERAAIIEQIPSGVIVYDRAGRVLQM